MASQELKPWYGIATPHKDIRDGNLEESIFAANIWAVVQNTAPEIYLDPEEFFLKTYITEGLVSVLTNVAKALKGKTGSGDRIISLQTAFGGGKTHTLVALWHLAKNHQKLRESPNTQALKDKLNQNFPDTVKGVAVFTNATCDAIQGRKTPEGIHLRTLWGEIAYQLGGPQLYEKIKINDEKQTVPQGIFTDILKSAAPCLILIDELADYCIGAAAVSVGKTTLADQTISFIQQLTEAVQQVPQSVLVCTLPASEMEVAQSEKGQELFSTLEKRFGRLGADYKPVGDHEIYEVVRARLFESITPEEETDYPEKVAQAYQKMYQSHSKEVPNEVSKSSYKKEIERSYPFHPSLIDTLYKRWGSHPDFQRTRGVLRLLASIVGDLWKKREGNTQSQHLIQPCHIRWSIDAIAAALTRLWGVPYQSVIASDIYGEKSNSFLLDEERTGDYQREGIAKGMASVILLGSFGGKGEQSGFNSKELKLACARPNLNWNYLDSALLGLEDHCFYLHTTVSGSIGKRYWFGTKPNLNKLIVQYRQNIKEKFDEKIREDLEQFRYKQQSDTGPTWRIIVAPEEDLAEQKSLSLLILPPSLSWDENEESVKSLVKKKILDISSKCGGKDRLYRNTLIFLVASSKGLHQLNQRYLERTALKGVHADYFYQLDPEQKEDLKKRLEQAERNTVECLGAAYTQVIRVHGQEIDIHSITEPKRDFHGHIENLWKILVEEEEWILRRIGSLTLENTGLVPKGEAISFKDAIETFLKFTDKPMISRREAVTEGIAQACSNGLIGIGKGKSFEELQSKHCNENISLSPDDQDIWLIPPFTPETRLNEPHSSKVAKNTLYSSSQSRESVKSKSEDSVEKTDNVALGKKLKNLSISGRISLDNFHELFPCFIATSSRMELDVEIYFSMKAVAKKEQMIEAEDPKIKAMEESASQLNLNFEKEETN